MSQINDIEQLTFKKVFGILTIKQFIAVVSSLAFIIGGAFTLGLNFERSTHKGKIQSLELKISELQNKIKSNETYIQHIRAKDKFLELTSVILFNAEMLNIDLWGGRRYYSHLTLDKERFNRRLEEYNEHVRKITARSGEKNPIADSHVMRAGPETLQFRLDRTNWVLIPIPGYIRHRRE